MPRAPSVSSLLTLLVAMLACGGPADRETPVPDVAPVTAGPLVSGRFYVSDPERADAPDFRFREDGTCDRRAADWYMCTWTATEADGRWTVEITGYTHGVTPDGEAMEDGTMPGGDRFEVSGDGQRLVAPNGQTYALEPEAGGGQTGKGRGDEPEAP